MIIDNPIVSGSLNVQNAVTASNISIASTASAAYFTGSFIGDGTQLSGVTSYTDGDTLDYINSLGVLSGSAQIASDISGSFTSVSQSLAQRITAQESFSQSLDATFATDQELSNVSGALALSISSISTDFADITNKPTLISGSAQIAEFGYLTSSSLGLNTKVGFIPSSSFTDIGSGGVGVASVVFATPFSSSDYSVALSSINSFEPSNFKISHKTSTGFVISGSSGFIGLLNLGTDSGVNYIAVANGETAVTSSFTLLSATASYVEYDNVANKPTLISSSAQFTDLTAPFTGSFTGSFIGDGSQLSGVTSYTDADTLAYINSRAVLSGSIAELTAVTASFLNTGSVTIPHSFNSKNVSVSVYDSNDILIIPQEIALISNNAVKLTFGGSTSGFAVVSKGGHIVSGSVPVPQLSTVTSAFTSATTHTVTHNFNTKEVIVSVYENDSLIIPDTVTTDDVNNVTVTFPEAISGRVVVVKAGHIVSGSIPFDNLLDSPFVQSATAVTASKSIVPSQDITYDLGSSDKRFRDLYLSSASIYLGNTVISEDNVVTTSSLQSVLPAGTLSGSAQIASDISGSFTSVSASIASERLKNTTDTLDGDLTVTGALTAQTLHVQEVTSSVLYSSGSNRFGEDASNVHQFTGSIRMAADSDLYVGRTLYTGHIDSGTSSTLAINAQSGFGIINLGSTYTQTSRLRVNYIDSGLGTGSLRIANDGNVGIGTPSPNAKLHIETGTDNNAGSGIRLNRTGAYYQALELTTNNVVDWSIGQNSNNSFQVYEDGLGATTRFTIKEGGNVGIGTTDPGENLHIFSAVSDVLLESTSVGSASRYLLKTTSRQWNIGTNSTVGSGNGLWFYDNNAGQYRMFIGTDGNVGIGTTTPNAILHAGSTGTNAYSSTITKGSNMKGIVTTVASNADDMVGIYFGTGGSTEGTHWSGITGARSDNASHWGTQLNFYTHDNNVNALNDATQKMVIMGDGNVGIGVTSPATKLTVGGGIRITGTGSGDSQLDLPINYGALRWYNGSTFKGGLGTSSWSSVGSGDDLTMYLVSGNFHISDTNSSIIATFNRANRGLGIGVRDDVRAKLHVNSYSVVPASTAISDDSKLVISGVDGNMDLFSTDDNTTVSNSIGFGRYNQSTGALIHKFGIVSWANTGNQGGNTGRKIAFHYGTTRNPWDSTELMHIGSNGYVGIGTTVANAPFDVQRGVRMGRGWHLTGRAGIRLDSDGTTRPADILFGHTAAGDEAGWTGVYWALSSRGSSAGNRFYVYRGSGQPAPNNSEAVLISLDPAMRVGIGEESPGSRLSVQSPDTLISDFYSPVADQLAYLRVWNAAQSSAGTSTAAAAIELVGKADTSTHGRHAWIGAEGVNGTTYATQVKFKVRGTVGYNWDGIYEAPTRMVIDGRGYVTKDAQPYFNVQIGTSAVTVNTDAKIPFSVVSHDIGSNFSTANSRFTCPVAGRYLFAFTSSIQEAVSGDYNAMYIRVNGNGTSFRFRTGPTASGIWTGITGSAILNLSAGDYVEIWAYTHTGSMTLQPNETLLTGYLLG